MHEKIYETFKKRDKESTLKYLKLLGKIDESATIDDISTTEYKNIDLEMLFIKFRLIKYDPENIKKINKFEEYLFKLGIKIGIVQGRKLVIKSIKRDQVKIQTLLEFPAENFTNYGIEPEELLNYKKTIMRKTERKFITVKHIQNREFSDEEYEIISNLADKNLDILYDDLKIDKKQIEKVNKKLVTIKPKSKEYPFKSTLYKNRKGKYKFQTLLYQYHEKVLKDSIFIGMQYGKRIAVEDLQNNRIDGEYIKNMSADEVEKYCNEVREDIEF